MPKSRRKPSGTAITSYARDITLANKANSTHATQHAKGGADPITPAAIGAAPAGYGLGSTTTKTISSLADLDTLTESGIYYYYNNDKAIEGKPYFQYCTVVVVTSDKRARTDQYVFPRGNNDRWMRRANLDYSSGWSAWEFGQVPLDIGVEYRTTERYLSKPVYVKVVDCGNLPNTTSKEVAHGIANVAYMIDVTLQGLNASSFTHNANELTVWANYECVYIKTLNDLSRYSVYASLRYTKTTD